MGELFETFFILSLLGTGITLVLLCLKPLTSKKFPAKWQYYAWIAVLITMIVPIFKLIPDGEVQRIKQLTHTETTVVDNEIEHTVQSAPNVQNLDVTQMTSGEIQVPDVAETVNVQPVSKKEVGVNEELKIKIINLFAVIWVIGMTVFILMVVLSYIIYILKKRKYAVLMEENSVLYDVKKELKIKRKIRIMMSPDVGSPMLVGILFPVIYMPCTDISNDMLRLVFLHELTHYKRKDLIVKWFALFVNAIHWFNPFAYIISANLSESCEISCDMKVTGNMNDVEQKLYMKTILELVEK